MKLLQELQPKVEIEQPAFEGWDIDSVYLMALVEADVEEESLPPISDKYGTYTISFDTYQSFVNGLAKVNKNAAKLGVPPLEIASKNKVTMRQATKLAPAVFGFEVVLKGQPVKINGWEFLASVEHAGGNGNALRFVPGMEDARVKQFATSSGRNCDFCHSNRDRNNTYIIRSVESGDLKQVGGQCLQKYIGDNARKLAKFSFHMDEFVGGLTGDRDGNGSSGVASTDVQTAVAAAIIVVGKYGFIRSGEPNATSSIVAAGLFRYGSKEFREEHEDVIAEIESLPNGDAATKADDMLSWFASLPEDSKESSYMISLESIINSGIVTPRSVGLISSLPAVHYRATAVAKDKEERVPSNWVGDVGAKISATKVTVLSATFHDGNYGQYQLVNMKDDSGNVYTWFNTSNGTMDSGKQYTIVGKVKKHDEYQGTKKTVLSHVKFNDA